MQAISGPAQPTYTAVVPTANPIDNPFVAAIGVERWNELSGGVPDTGLVCPITLIQNRLFELLLEVVNPSSLDWQNAVGITMHATLLHSLLLGLEGFYSVNGAWLPNSPLHSNETTTKACKNILQKLETAYRTLGYKPLIDWAIVLKKAMPGNDYALTHPVGYSLRKENWVLLTRVIASRAAIMKPYHHPFSPVIEQAFDSHQQCWEQMRKQPEKWWKHFQAMKQTVLVTCNAMPSSNSHDCVDFKNNLVQNPLTLSYHMARRLTLAHYSPTSRDSSIDLLADLTLYQDIAARLRNNLPDDKVAGKGMSKVREELTDLLNHWDGFWPNIDWATQIHHPDGEVRHFYYNLLASSLGERIAWAETDTKACYTAIDKAYQGAPTHLKQRLNRLRLFVQQAELAFKIGAEAIIGGSKDRLPTLGEVLGPTTVERQANMAALIAEEEAEAPKEKPKPAVEWNWTTASSSSSSEEVAVEVPEVTPIPFGNLIDSLAKLKPSGEGAKQRAKHLRAVPEVVRLNLRRWEEIRDRTTLPAARQKMLIAHGLCEAALRAMVMHYLPDGLALQHTHNLNLPIGALHEAVPSTRDLFNDHQGLLRRVGRAHGALNFGEGRVSLDDVDELVEASIEFVTAAAMLVQQGEVEVTPYRTKWVEEALATERAEGSAVVVDETATITGRPERVETADDARALLPAAIESIPLLESVRCLGDKAYRDRMLNVGAQSMEVVNAKLTGWNHSLPLSDILEGLRQGERGLRAMLLARAEQAGFERIHAPSRPNTTRPLTHDGNLTHIFRQLMTYPELKPDSLPDLTTPWLAGAHHRLNHPTPPDGNSDFDRLINDILKLSADYDKLRPCAEDEKVGKLSWPKWNARAEKIRERALPFLIQLVDATIQTTLNDWPLN